MNGMQPSPAGTAPPGGRGGAIALIAVGALLDIVGLAAIVATLGNYHIVNHAEYGTARIIGGAVLGVATVLEVLGIGKLRRRS